MKIEPVAVGGADMGYRSRHHRGKAHCKVAVADIVEFDGGWEIGGSDREERRGNKAIKRLGQRLSAFSGPIDVQRGIRTKQRRKKWQTLNVVPVKMCNQRMQRQPVLGRHCTTPRAQPRTQVQNDRVVIGGFNRDATGVAAIALHRRATTRRRTTNTVERHYNSLLRIPHCLCTVREPTSVAHRV